MRSLSSVRTASEKIIISNGWWCIISWLFDHLPWNYVTKIAGWGYNTNWDLSNINIHICTAFNSSLGKRCLTLGVLSQFQTLIWWIVYQIISGIDMICLVDHMHDMGLLCAITKTVTRYLCYQLVYFCVEYSVTFITLAFYQLMLRYSTIILYTVNVIKYASQLVSMGRQANHNV